MEELVPERCRHLDRQHVQHGQDIVPYWCMTLSSICSMIVFRLQAPTCNHSTPHRSLYVGWQCRNFFVPIYAGCSGRHDVGARKCKHFTALTVRSPKLRCAKLTLSFSSTDQILLSTHADRQGVDISVTACVFVCTVTDFPAEDKASGVRFCTAVHRRPRQGISHFCELWSPEALNRTNRPSRHHLRDVHNDYPLAPEHMSAACVDVGSACVDIRQLPEYGCTCLNNVTNLHQLTSQCTTPCPKTWRSCRDYRLLWSHFTLFIQAGNNQKKINYLIITVTKTRNYQITRTKQLKWQ